MRLSTDPEDKNPDGSKKTAMETGKDMLLLDITRMVPAEQVEGVFYPLQGRPRRIFTELGICWCIDITGLGHHANRLNFKNYYKDMWKS